VLQDVDRNITFAKLDTFLPNNEEPAGAAAPQRRDFSNYFLVER
jgi:hypothetical protein